MGWCAWISVTGIHAADDTLFEKKIRPIFVEHCYECHSAKAEKLKGGLRLDTSESILRGGTSGKAIIPGDAANSLLLKAVRGEDPDLKMPAKGAPLSLAQIEDLTEWVATGAILPTNAVSNSNTGLEAKSKWAFSPPLDPKPPSIKNVRWPKQPWDRFVLAKLEKEGIKPASATDKRTLIRRATYDLIGLPPTPDEIRAFIEDNSAQAFARVVDRLLSSPHYGERWGRHWLDVVRYADSADARVTGGPEDIAEAWRYRDWVVNAFNRDLPYDQFLTQQIAGDLLPLTKPDSIDTNNIIATGMYAIGNWGNGDADKEKVLTDIADDAVDVTGRALLGLTISCARCHDHKFDPIKIEDYYGMAGIFFSTHMIPKLSPKGAGESLLRIPLVSSNEMKRREGIQTRIVELETEVERITNEEIKLLASEMLPQVDKYLLGTTATARSNSALNGTILKRWSEFLNTRDLGLLPNPIRNTGPTAGLLVWRNRAADDTPAAIYNSSDKELAKTPPRGVAIHPAPQTGIAVAWQASKGGSFSIRGKLTDVDAACGDGIKWSIEKRVGTKLLPLAEGTIANGASQDLSADTYTKSLSNIDCMTGDMLQVTVYPNNGHSCDTTLIELEISSGELKWNLSRDAATDFLASNPLPDQSGNDSSWYLMDLGAQPANTPNSTSLLSEWTNAPKESNPALPAVALSIQQKLTEASTNTNAPTADRQLFTDLTNPRGPFWAPLRSSVTLTNHHLSQLKAELKEKRTEPIPPVQFALGLQEGGVPESPHAGVHDVKVHIRGRYDRLGDTVPRHFPTFLAGENQTAITNGSGRVELAAWLTSTNNPLTARVLVNRIWQNHFGEGIVRTPNNFGKLGAEPTHPELLDFLAHRFMESGWSIKQLHRTLMLSATYQQSSITHEAKRDPENKFFGRANRRRLEAEPFRDSLLQLAGNLDRTLGGPSLRELENSRRTLYLMTIRSDRSSYRMLFDAADPVSISEQRVVSTVAPQALFLLNHPFVLKQATALAKSIGDASRSDQKNIAVLYERLYGRAPDSKELKTGLAALRALRQDPVSEQKETTAEKRDFQAWEHYCQVLLCANEFVYID